MALSLDSDQRSNQETIPEKTPSKAKWLKHLLGIDTYCGLSSPLVALTGSLRDRYLSKVTQLISAELLILSTRSGRSWVNWSCWLIWESSAFLSCFCHSCQNTRTAKCHLIQEAFPQTSTHSPRKFLYPPPLGPGSIKPSSLRSSFL